MRTAIIHISDLHVSLFTLRNSEPNKRLNSYLTTNIDTSHSDFFVQTFIKKIKEDFDGFDLCLLITGDIADVSDSLEYESATKFIQEIISQLNIPLEKLLLIPGDHDISRLALDIELNVNPSSECHLMNEIKYREYAKFYKAIKDKDFPFNKTIVEHVVVNDRIMLVGCNSNYLINNTGGLGFIDIVSFRSELRELKEHINNPNLEVILCWHHNITAGYDDKAIGQWEKANRQHLIAEIQSENIKLILTGNEHISDSRGILGEQIMTSDAGAFAPIKSQSSFKVYSIENGQELKLINLCYVLQNLNANDVAYYWSRISSKDCKQHEHYTLFIPNNQQINDTIELPNEAEGFIEEEKVEVQQVLIKDGRTDDIDEEEIKIPIYYDNSVISEKLYEILKDEKLFHSGHFHWSETSRAHNWIDVSKMLQKSENIYFAQNAVIDVIEQFKLNNSFDLIIGLGYEGNIISSKASIKYSKPYTSLPYSYRYDDHHSYEKRLNFDNSNSDYKNILIITDVVNDGRTIRKLIGKREKDFFDKIEKIIVISLFYTGHEIIDVGILNSDHFPPEYDVENDHIINNIEFYTVKTMRVEKCPYNNENFRKECLIYKDDLSCVHLFYDEEIAQKKAFEKLIDRTNI